MIKLETRFYPREEIAEIIGLEKDDKHFARDVKNSLTNWGYGFVYSRKGVTIEKVPTTVEERVAEIAQRRLGLDVRCDAVAFSAYFYLLTSLYEFQCCPENERLKMLKKDFGIEIGVATMRRWTKKLFDLNIAIKDDADKELWMTTSFNGEKHQEPVCETDDVDFYYNVYSKERKELIDAAVADEKETRPPYAVAIKTLWDKYKVCYYYCKPIVFNGIMDDDVKELFSLVEDYVVTRPEPEEDEERTVRITPLESKEFRF